MASMRLPARPSLINSTPPWTLGQGWTHASGRRCTPGLIHRMTQGSTLASMSHPAPSGVDITPVVASQKCADGLDQRVPFLSLTELTRAPRQRPRGARTSKAMGGRGAAEIDRRTDVAHDLHRRGLARNRPRGCPDGFLRFRSPGPFIHRRAVRAVRHLAESPPCPASAVKNPRAAAGRHPYPATTSAMAPPRPPHPPDLPGPPR